MVSDSQNCVGSDKRGPIPWAILWISWAWSLLFDVVDHTWPIIAYQLPWTWDNLAGAGQFGKPVHWAFTVGSGAILCGLAAFIVGSNVIAVIRRA